MDYGKVLKTCGGVVWLGAPDGSVEKVPLEAFGFDPQEGDWVRRIDHEATGKEEQALYFAADRDELMRGGGAHVSSPRRYVRTAAAVLAGCAAALLIMKLLGL